MLNTVLSSVVLCTVLPLWQVSAEVTSRCPSSVPQDKFNRVFQGRCYRFDLTRQREYKQAELSCRSHGGHLAMPKTGQINSFLASHLRNTYRYPHMVWIGLNDLDDENVFEWADGTKLGSSYSNWADGDEGPRKGILHPFRHLYQDCVVLDAGGQYGKWRDYRCHDLSIFENHHRYFICEFPIVFLPKTTTVKPKKTIQPSPLPPTFTTKTPTTTKMTSTTEKPTTSLTTPIDHTFVPSSNTVPSTRMTMEMTSHKTSRATRYDMRSPMTTYKMTHGMVSVVSSQMTTEIKTITSRCPPSVPQDKFNRVFQGRCYRFDLTRQREYKQAELSCRSHGGHLAMPKTGQINSFLTSHLRNTYRYPHMVWIGLNDLDDENVFEWADGTKLGSSYSNWADGDEGPSKGILHPFRHLYEDCVVLDAGGQYGKWRDYRCHDLSIFENHHRYFICEFPVVFLPKTTTAKPKKIIQPSPLPPTFTTKTPTTTKMTSTTEEPTTSSTTPIDHTFVPSSNTVPSTRMTTGMTSHKTSRTTSYDMRSHMTSEMTHEMLSVVSSQTTNKMTHPMTRKTTEETKSPGTTLKTTRKSVKTDFTIATSPATAKTKSSRHTTVKVKMTSPQTTTRNRTSPTTIIETTSEMTIETGLCPSSIPQDRFNQVFQGRCFRFVFQTKLIYWEAQRYCKDRGGNLAMPKTRAINAFLAKHVHFIYGYWQGVWIGLHDRDGDRQYTWTDGSTLDSFTNWGQGHPGSEASSSSRAHHMYDNCVALDGSSGEGRWQDHKCWHMAFAGEERKYFVCQFHVRDRQKD